ncbi:hypothetical protein AC481_06690 [miscellaneous Crenarchaeota group archaeon SMTZ-80]|nr:MAG: hypothetical protein AC481_06690 [miscellaneous Crenarchaeota group archaeon SMTZ-80]
MNILNSVVENYCELPRILRKPMWQVWHRLLIRFDKDITVNFMNYGYNSLNGETPLSLKKDDEKNRYCIQLYDRVVRNNDLKNKDILEVGSGRGGGASYLARYYSPKSYTGLDISSSIIDFCNNYYSVPGLFFVKGAAENLPFRNNSFDIVINIESARCYGDIKVFFHEVYRVLRPGGYFLLADMIKKDEVEDMHYNLRKGGFGIIENNNITRNVINALGKDTARREELIKLKIPGILRSSFIQFAATSGTERYLSFTNGKFEYWTFILKRS